MTHTLILFTFVQMVGSSVLKMPEASAHERAIRESLTQCVVSAVERFFPEERTVFYSLPLSGIPRDSASVTPLDRVLLAELTARSKWSVVVKNVSLKQTDFDEHIDKPHYYIVQMRNPDEFLKNVDIMKRYQSWNPHAKFLIVSPTAIGRPRKLAATVMRILWDVHVVNSVVLLPHPSTDTVFNAYTWYPYKDGNCGTDFDKVTRIDTCSFGTNTEQTDWYVNKIPKKFNRCTINVRLITWPPYVIQVPNGSWSTSVASVTRGIEVNLLDILAENFNLRMFYYYSSEVLDWGEVYKNGTITGNLKYLYDEIDDISLGAYAKTMQKSILFEDTYYHYESLVFCVPYDSYNTKLESVSRIMGMGALLMTILVYGTATTLMWVFSTEDVNSYRNLDICIINNFSVLLGFSVPTKPRTTKVRYFMAMFLIYSFCIVTAYQTLLASALANASEKQEVNTVGDLVESDMDIYGLKDVQRYFATDGSNLETRQINAAILNKWKICTNINTCLSYVAFKREAAICLPNLFREYIFNGYRTSRNDPLMHCFDKFVVAYPLTILMRRGFQLYKKFEFSILRIMSSGFLQKWESDILRTRYENFTKTAEETTRGSDGELDFDSLKPVFFVWCVGNTSASVAFLCEVFFYKWLNEKFEKLHRFVVRRRKV